MLFWVQGLWGVALESLSSSLSDLLIDDHQENLRDTYEPFKRILWLSRWPVLTPWPHPRAPLLPSSYTPINALLSPKEKQVLIREALLLGHLGYLEEACQAGELSREEIPLEELWLAFARPLILNSTGHPYALALERSKHWVDKMLVLKTGAGEASEKPGEQVARELLPFFFFLAWGSQTSGQYPPGGGKEPPGLLKRKMETWKGVLDEMGLASKVDFFSRQLPFSYEPSPLIALLDRPTAKKLRQAKKRGHLPRQMCQLWGYALDLLPAHTLHFPCPLELQKMVADDLGLEVPKELWHIIFDFVPSLLPLSEQLLDSLPVHTPLYHTLRGYGVYPTPPPSGSSWQVWGAYYGKELRFQVGAFMVSTSRLDRWCRSKSAWLLERVFPLECLACNPEWLENKAFQLCGFAKHICSLQITCMGILTYLVLVLSSSSYTITTLVKGAYFSDERSPLLSALISLTYAWFFVLLLLSPYTQTFSQVFWAPVFFLEESLHRYPLYYLHGHGGLSDQRHSPSSYLKHTFLLLPCCLALSYLNIRVYSWLIGG